MYIIKNAIRNITRSIGRNLIIAIIITIITIASCVTITINKSGNALVNTYKKNNPLKVTLNLNAMNYRGAENQVKEEFELISLDTYKEIGDMPDVNAYYYSVTTYLNSDAIEKVSYNDLFKKPSEKEEEANRGSMPKMPFGGGGRKEIKFTNGDFSIVAYSDIAYNEDFLNGTKKIIEGEMISNDSTKKEIVISEELATDNEIEVGDKIKFTNAYDEDVTYSLKVVGIYSEESTDAGFNPMQNSRGNQLITNLTTIELIREDDDSEGFEASNSIKAVYYVDNDNLDEFTEGVRYLGVSEYYEILTNEDEILETLTPIQNIASFSLTFLLLVLIVGASVLTLINLFNIRERKYEIGVLRAIGMTKMKVTLQLVCEILIVALASLIIGTSVGAVLSQPVSDLMLKSEIESMNNKEEEIMNNFGGGDFKMPPNMGGGRPGFNDMPGKDIEYIDTLDVKMDLVTLLELFGVSLLLTAVSGIIAVVNVNKYEPNRILQNRN